MNLPVHAKQDSSTWALAHAVVGWQLRKQLPKNLGYVVAGCVAVAAAFRGMYEIWSLRQQNDLERKQNALDEAALAQYRKEQTELKDNQRALEQENGFKKAAEARLAQQARAGKALQNQVTVLTQQVGSLTRDAESLTKGREELIAKNIKDQEQWQAERRLLNADNERRKEATNLWSHLEARINSAATSAAAATASCISTLTSVNESRARVLAGYDTAIAGAKRASTPVGTPL